MLRPKLRPTLSRKTKYWGIAPTAQQKLGREARRGSHDLRKLVGHANFLDVLIEQLDPADEEAIARASAERARKQEEQRLESLKEVDDSSSSDNDSEEWSDASDNEDHSLCLTRSRVAGVHGDELSDEAQTSPSNDGEDYFHMTMPKNAAIQLEAMAIRDEVTTVLGLQEDRKNRDVSVSVTSVLETPPASPTDERDGEGSQPASRTA